MLGNGTSLFVQSGTGTVTQSIGTLELGANTALSAGTVQINGGTIEADSPSALLSASLVYDAAGTNTYQGRIAGAGNSLTLDNPAAVLILSGSDTYTGGTNVLGGTLIVDSSKALPAGTSLTVGTRADSAFGPVEEAARTFAPGGAVSVPEPSTLAMLGMGALALMWRARIRRKWSRPGID